MAQTIMPLTAENFPDAIVGSANNYDIESLPEYNSGADLFIEFGFRSLLVQQISWETAKIKVEVYQMMTPEAAFGIYSLSVLKCQQQDSLTPFDCNTVYQYQAAYGNLYISVTSESGSVKARAMYLPVANAIMQKNIQQVFALPDPFNQPRLKKARKSLVYMQGTTGLENSVYPFQEMFLTVRFRMYAISLPNPDFLIYFARIRFETPADMMRFLTLAGLTQNGIPVPNTNTNDGLYREYQQLDEVTVYFLQSQEPWPISAIIQP
ncbi:MAG: hypothetical protein NT040_06070 [Bacteroidetes bacterium]|nr:hypothetical protein [Bacteroidota bacterium]